MKRILIIGCPGSGKSYFAKRLGEILNLKVIHMDNLYWRNDKTAITREELLMKLQPYLEEENWIIDGNYHHTLENRLKYATDVFFLDLSKEECEQGILERVGKKRDDIPWIETKEDALELIAWNETYEERTKQEEINLLKQYPHLKIKTFKSRKEIADYLFKINKKSHQGI